MSNDSAFKIYSEAKHQQGFWVERVKSQFAVTVERLLDYRGLKKKDLADRMEVSRPYITKVLRGDANLTLETIGRLAYVLGTEVTINLSPKESQVKPWLYAIGREKKPATQLAIPKARDQTPDSNEINLTNYFLPIIEVAANPSHEPSEKTMTIFSVNAQVEETENEAQYAVNIEVLSNQEESTNPPYTFRLSGVAFFIITSEEYDDNNAKEVCFQIGHQVLLGAIREQITTLTGRGPWNAVQLRVIPAKQLTDQAQPNKAP